MSRPRAVLALALAAASATAAGCGDDSLRKANAGEVRSIVTRFASADDASACSLLSGHALQNVYGGFRDPVRVARRKCVGKSAKFRGEPIDITETKILDEETAKVSALSKDRRFTYSVTLRRPRKHWRIDQISVHKVR